MKPSVVAVVAHPDDESLIAGGTLALAAQAGAQTGVVSLTRGEQGPAPPGAVIEPEELARIRERELRAAADALGVGWVSCLRHPDGELQWIDHAAVASELAALLRPHSPVVLLTFGPDGLYWHPDHIAVWEIVRRAAPEIESGVSIYEAAWPAALMSALVKAAAARGLPVGLWGLEPEAFGSDRSPTLEVDVRRVLERKLAAVRAHRSQIGADHLLGTLPDDLAERYLALEPWVGPADGPLAEVIRDG